MKRKRGNDKENSSVSSGEENKTWDGKLLEAVKRKRNKDDNEDKTLGVIKEALINGANINVHDSAPSKWPEATPLHWAVCNNDFELVKYLLECGADVNSKCNFSLKIPQNDTPLHIAAWNGYCEVGELLLQNGADMTAKTTHSNETPKEYAREEATKNFQKFRDLLEKYDKQAARVVISNPHLKILNSRKEQLEEEKMQVLYQGMQEQEHPIFNSLNPTLPEELQITVSKPILLFQSIGQNWLKFSTNLEPPTRKIVAQAILQTDTELQTDRELQADTELQGKNQVDQQTFNAHLIQNIFKDLTQSGFQISKEDLSQLTDRASSVVGQYRAEFQNIVALFPGGNLETKIIAQAKSLISDLQRSELNINNCVAQANNPTSVRDIARELEGFVNTVTGGFKSSSVKDAVEFAGNLFGQINHITEGINSALEKVNNIEKELVTLVAGNADTFVVFNKRLQLEAEKLAYQNQQTAFNNTLDTIHKGFEVAGKLAALAGDNKLAQQLVTVGEAAVTIAQNVGAIIAGSAILGPIGVIGGAVVSLLSVLGIFGKSEPSKEQKMMQQLSEQIGKFVEHVDKRFDAIEKMLGTIHEQMHSRFDRLETMLHGMHEQMHQRFDRLELQLDHFYTKAMSEFRSLDKGLKGLQQIANEINERANKIEKKLDEGFFGQHMSEYKKLKNKVKVLLDINNPDRLQEKAETYSMFLKTHAVKEAKDKRWTGTNDRSISLFNLEEDAYLSHATAWCEEIETKPFAFVINSLATLTKYEANIANPILWADATYTYLTMLTQTPGIKASQSHQKHIAEMRQVGINLREFIFAIKTDEQLFGKLCSNYNQGIKQAVAATQQCSVADIADDTNIQTALKKLSIHYKLLVIFVYLAFTKKDGNTHDPLCAHLKNRVLHEKNIRFLINKASSEEHKEFICKMIEEHTFAALNKLEELIFTEVIKTKQMETKQTKSGEYPFVDSVLEALDSVQQHGELLIGVKERKVEKYWSKDISAAAHFTDPNKKRKQTDSQKEVQQEKKKTEYEGRPQNEMG